LSIGYSVWAVIAGVILYDGSTLDNWRKWLTISVTFGLPALLHALAIWGVTFADRMILTHYSDLGDVGVYGIAYQIASLLSVIVTSTGNAWLSVYYEDENLTYDTKRFSASLDGIFTLFIGSFFFVYIFAHDLILVFADPGYLGGLPVVRIVSVGLLGFGIAYIHNIILMYYDKERIMSLISALCLVVNVGANIILIPDIGVRGAAISSLITFWLMCACSCLYLYHSERVFIRLRSFMLFGLSIVAALVVTPLLSISFYVRAIVFTLLSICLVSIQICEYKEVTIDVLQAWKPGVVWGVND
jgi:O-antigen/teichoic acid export membrane protein